LRSVEAWIATLSPGSTDLGQQYASSIAGD
jgi:hypothetical protein